MADGFTLQVIATSTVGSSTDREKSISSSISAAETFWSEARLAAAASNVQVYLNMLTDPAVLLVFGGEGVWATISLDGDKVRCDPVGVLTKVTGLTGLGLTSIYLGNDSNSERSIAIVAVEK